eukprot:2481755-Rhodomonas_salina.1
MSLSDISYQERRPTTAAHTDDAQLHGDVRAGKTKNAMLLEGLAAVEPVWDRVVARVPLRQSDEHLWACAAATSQLRHTPHTNPTTGPSTRQKPAPPRDSGFKRLPFPARSDPPQSSVLSHLPGSTITPVSVPQGTLWYTAVVPGPASYQTLRYGTQRQYHKPYSVSTMLHSISTRSRMLLRKGTYLVASEALARGRSSLGPSS